MLYIALAFVMILPLFGVIAMESGESSPFVDAPGAPNGASLAYVVHLIAFATAFIWVMRFGGRSQTSAHPPRTLALSRNLQSYAIFCAAVFVVLAALMLFVFGGLDVLLLRVDKAEFRISLGPFGAVMTIATKWLMPTMFAALIYAAKCGGWTAITRIMAVISGAGLIIVGASWGFKTTILFMLLPTFIITTWKMRFRTLVWMAIPTLALVLGSAFYFDQYEDANAALEGLALRLTALQGDLAWYTWERVRGGNETPSYLITFLPVFGDRVLQVLTGASATGNYTNWANYYYGNAMTLWGGAPTDVLQNGTNNQATLFAESLVIGGRFLFALVSACFGALIGLFARWIRSAITLGSPPLAATLATFFALTVIPWALGNGLASLIYLLNVVGALVSYGVVSVFFMARSTDRAMYGA